MGVGSLEIEALYTRYLKAVLTYVSHRVSDRTEAEDITAETFAAAMVALPRYRGECSPQAWLLGIARQKIAEAFRRRRHHREFLETELSDGEQETLSLLLIAETDPLPEQVVLNAEARKVIRYLLDSLPASQREAILLQFVHELPVREIAVVMGRSIAAINSLLERGRANLFRLGKEYFAG